MMSAMTIQIIMMINLNLKKIAEFVLVQRVFWLSRVIAKVAWHTSIPNAYKNGFKAKIQCNV